MADKVRERNPDKMAERSANNPSTLLRTVPDSGVGMGRMEEQEKGSLHLNQSPGSVPPPRKKTSSFQITSVTVGSRLSNDGGDDSADDLDESHTEDISSELLDISKTTDLDNDYSSEDAFSSVDQISMPPTVGTMHPLLHLPNNGQGDASQVSNVVSNPEDAHDRSIPWHTRFRVVKIESTEPFKRGRWICMDFLDPPPSQTEPCDTREGGSGNSSTASSVHYSESYIEIPIGQEMFYQQSESQHHAFPVQAVHHTVTASEQQHQHQQQQPGQTQQQQQPPPPQQQNMGQQGLTDYQNVVGGVGPTQHQQQQQQQQQQQHQGQSLGGGLPPQGNVAPTSIMPTQQQMPVHHSGSLPVPLQGQPNAPVPQQQQGGEFYNVPQSGGGTISAPQTQNEFQGAPVGACAPTGDYSTGASVPTSGMHHAEYGQVHPEYGQVHPEYGQVHPACPTSASAGMGMPMEYNAQTQSMPQQGDYGMPPDIPPQGEYMNMHQQQPTEYMNVHQQSHIGQGMPPQQEYMHQQGEYSQAQSMGPGPNLQQQQQQCNSMPPQGDYSHHQQQVPHMASDYSQHSQSVSQQGSAVASNMGQGSTIPSNVTQQGPQQQQSQSCVPPQSQSLPNTVPQSISSIGDYGVGQVNAPSNSQQQSNLVPPLSMSNQPQSGSSEQQVYSVSSSRPSTISLSSSALEGGEPVGSLSVAVTPPVLDNLGVASKDGDDTESASGSSTVAIDNKIEQAMDLVKSHLMFAVREEVDVLKEKITELMDRINQLEYENSILRAAASQETLAKLAQPPPKPPPPNPSS